MKLLSAVLFISVLYTGYSQSRQLRLTLQSHNEMSDPINYMNGSNWTNVKAKLAMLVDTLEFYQAKYNLQCESNFIRANIANDNAASLTTDLLETMENHALIEVDPHNHLNKDVSAGFNYNPYNYADLAKLLDSCGITRITTVGGYIYQSTEWTYPTDEDWTTYPSGITGNYFPNETWTPTFLWGGGTLNHVNDPFSLGVWRPAGSTAMTFRNHSSVNLPNIGNGCSWVIQNNTNIDSLITQLQNYTDYFTNHAPSDPDMFICGTVIFNYRYILTAGYIEKVCEFIRKVNPMVQNNRIIWQNLNEKYTAWENAHANPADNYSLFCDDLPANLGVDEEFVMEGKLYPNPNNGTFSVLINETTKALIYDLKGNLVQQTDLYPGTNTISSVLQPGIYMVKMTNMNEESLQRLVVQ